MTDALDHAALVLAQNIVDLWNNYSDENSEQTDLAMRDACKEAQAMDLRQVDGLLASPLRYFARAFLEDDNPEDLTICEMVESLKISIQVKRNLNLSDPNSFKGAKGPHDT